MMKTKTGFLFHRDIIYITVIIILFCSMILSYKYGENRGISRGALYYEDSTYIRRVGESEVLRGVLQSMANDLNGDKRDKTIDRLNNLVKEFGGTGIEALLGILWDYIRHDDGGELKGIVREWKEITSKQRTERMEEIKKQYTERVLIYYITYPAVIVIFLCCMFISYRYGENIGRKRGGKDVAPIA